MSNTVNNNIPFVPENTIDPAAGLNESLNIIDMMLQLAVLSVNANTPPSSPAEGDRYIIGTAPTGAWVGWAGFLARYLDGYWRFLPARLAFNLADGVLYGRRTTTWLSVAGSGGVAWGSITGTLSAQTDLANALAGKVATTQLGANSGVATLDAAGKIPVSQLPPLAVNEVFTVASQAAMLALTAERGDVAIRTDLAGQAFILSADAPGTLANWISLQQALSIALAALNALTPAADRLPYFDSTSTAALAVFTAQARTLLAATTQSAQKTVLGLELVDNTSDANKPVSGPTNTAIVASSRRWSARVAMASAAITLPDTAGGTLYNVSSANPVITLPVAANMPLGSIGFRYVGSGTATFIAQGSDLIVLETAQIASFTLTRGMTVELMASGNLWFASAKGILVDAAPIASPNFQGTIGLGTQTLATALNIQPPAGTLTTANQTGVRVRPTIDPSLASVFIANQTDPVIEDKTGTLTAARGFRAFAPTFLGATPTVTLATGFDVPTSSSTQVLEFRAFESAVNTVGSLARWQTYNSGTAPSYMNGDLRLGTLTQSGTDKLTVAGSASFTGALAAGGPVLLGRYTLSGLPSASANQNALIIVTNATGGAKVCWSNGTNWCLLNTSTVVS